MAIMYVSDVLEDILQAQAIRNLVRRQCVEVLRGLPHSTAAALAEPLHYISGKCMGYPAVWAIQKALGADSETIANRLSRSPGPLYLSLTTSVADDFLDKDERIGAPHMMLLYMFIFAALRQDCWMKGPLGRKYVDQVYPLVAGFLRHPSHFDAAAADATAALAHDAGRRIGAFFETIAFSLLDREPESMRDGVTEIVGRFGDWCSHLDDIVDIERDISDGAPITVPMHLLALRSEALRKAVSERNVAGCMAAIESPEYLASLVDTQLKQMARLIEMSTAAGYRGLAAEFSRIAGTLPRAILSIRTEVAQRVHWQSGREQPDRASTPRATGADALLNAQAL